MPLLFDYTNYQGETSRRRVMPYCFWYGKSKYHVDEAGNPVEQWFLQAYDLDKQADRDFAWLDIVPVFS